MKGGEKGAKGGDKGGGAGGGKGMPGDWTCPNCGASCFASKRECFLCGTAKPRDLDDGPARRSSPPRRDSPARRRSSERRRSPSNKPKEITEFNEPWMNDKINDLIEKFELMREEDLKTRLVAAMQARIDTFKEVWMCLMQVMNKAGRKAKQALTKKLDEMDVGTFDPNKDDDEEEGSDGGKKRSRSKSKKRSRSRSRRKKSRSRSRRKKSRSRSRGRKKSRSRGRKKSRSRSRSRRRR